MSGEDMGPPPYDPASAVAIIRRGTAEIVRLRAENDQLRAAGLTEEQAVRFLQMRGYLVKRARSPIVRDTGAVVQRYLAGESLKQIADAYATEPSAILSALRRAGVERRPPGRQKKTRTVEARS